MNNLMKPIYAIRLMIVNSETNTLSEELSGLSREHERYRRTYSRNTIRLKELDKTRKDLLTKLGRKENAN